jgi:prepilin-type N-terminal cleavage/methylation domain-containing protein
LEFGISKKGGFTLVELLVSIVILLIITVSVTINITKTKMREELDASARQVGNTLRNLQAQALAARSVLTCQPATIVMVCENGTAVCGAAACATQTVPTAVGMTLAVNASAFSAFAEADTTLDDRYEDTGGRESLARTFLTSSASAGSGAVKITSLTGTSAAGVQTSFASASVAFERQNGNMRINACGTPALAPACGANGEPLALSITLTHSTLGKSDIVTLNRLTGKISIE